MKQDDDKTYGPYPLPPVWVFSDPWYKRLKPGERMLLAELMDQQPWIYDRLMRRAKSTEEQKFLFNLAFHHSYHKAGRIFVTGTLIIGSLAAFEKASAAYLYLNEVLLYTYLRACDYATYTVIPNTVSALRITQKILLDNNATMRTLCQNVMINVGAQIAGHGLREYQQTKDWKQSLDYGVKNIDEWDAILSGVGKWPAETLYTGISETIRTGDAFQGIIAGATAGVSSKTKLPVKSDKKAAMDAIAVGTYASTFNKWLLKPATTTMISMHRAAKLNSDILTPFTWQGVCYFATSAEQDPTSYLFPPYHPKSR
ncbi:MAG: hypothetical protein ACTTKI_00160 [Tannerella sp.]|uniref:hypothetical protein n=1 Tax=Tannerella sp. TaxID=2382127 RepID=UPI003FA262A8